MRLSFKLANGKVIEESISQDRVTIGRSNKADVVIPDESLSRVHCQIEQEAGNFFITDMGSANGVYIDGNRITANQRTSFQTFMQLSIGPIEVFIQEDNEGTLTLETNTVEAFTPHQSSMGRQAPPSERSRSAPSRSRENKSANKSFNPKVLGLFLAVAIGGAFYVYQDAEEFTVDTVSARPDTPVAGPQKVALKRATVPAEFSTRDVYLNLSSKKNCSEYEELCKEFRLVDSEGEGIVVEGKEAYVYMWPASFYSLPHLKFLKGKPYAEEMISHYMVLKSPLMDKVYQGELDQVHLLMLNDVKTIVKIFRYHAHQFNEENEDRFRYVEMLTNAFLNQNIDEAVPLLQKEIPSTDLKTE